MQTGRFQPPSCRTDGEERRVMCRVLGLWHGWGGATGAVPADVFDDSDLGPHLYAIRLVAPAMHSSFVRCGTVLSAFCRPELIGCKLQDVLPPALSVPMNEFLNVLLQYRQPLADAGSFLRDGREILYRNVLMPVGSVGGESVQLIGAFNYRVASR